MLPIKRVGFPDNYRTPLFLFLCLCLSFAGHAQAIYRPGAHVVVNDAVAPTPAVPLDARTMKYDSINFLYRAYNGTAEVLTYLNTANYRSGNFILVVDSGGALQSNGTYIGGYNTFYMFKDSTTAGGLVKMDLFGMGAGVCTSCLLVANNLSDLASLSTALINLGLNNVNNTSDATKNAATVALTNHTISGSANTFTNIPNSALTNNAVGLTLNNTGTTPQVTTTPAALGTSLVMTVPWTNGSDSGFLKGTDWSFFDGKLDSVHVSNDSVYNCVNGTCTLQSVIVAGGAVNSVNGTNASLLFSPSTGNVLGQVNPAFAYNWTGQHTFLSFAPIFSTLTTSGGLFYGNGSGQLLQTAAGTSAQILESQGGTAPLFFTPDATTVSGWLGYTPLSGTLGSTQLYVGNALNTATAVNMSGDVHLSNTGAATIQPNVVTYSKIQAASQQALLGATGAGNYQEITLGTNLSMSGSVLNASAGGILSLTGTSGGPQTGSAQTFSTTTSTASTALTIPGATNTFTFTYNPAWDFGDNSRSANNNYFFGPTAGNTSITGVRNVAIGTTAGGALTTGNNNVFINMDAGFATTTGSDIIALGYLSEAGNVGGLGSIGIGGQAGRNDDTSANVFVGYESGTSNVKGSPNVGVGRQALFSNVSGVNNTGIGDQALKNATGSYNTGLGALTLTTLTSGHDNGAAMFGSLSGCTTCTFDNAVGNYALNFETIGGSNLAAGFKALQQDPVPFGNVALGHFALTPSASDTENVVIGYWNFGGSSPVSPTSAYRSNKFTNSIGDSNEYNQGNLASLSHHNISDNYFGNGINVVGVNSGDTTRTGSTAIGNHINVYSDNTAYFGANGQIVLLGDSGTSTTAINLLPNIASGIVWNQTTGTYWFNNGSTWAAIGGGGGSGVTTIGSFSNSSIANGGSIGGVTLTFGGVDGTNPGMVSEVAQTMGAGIKTFTSDMVIDGINAGKGVSSGAQNTAFGNGAMRTAGTYTSSTAIGFDVLFNSTTSGIQNTGVGATSQQNITSGSNNTAVGFATMKENFTGVQNTVMGASADFGSGGGGFASSFVSAFGYNALNVNQGNYNSAFGNSALQSNTTGIYNLAFGTGGLSSNTTGNYNLAAGANTGNSITTGSYEILLGPWVDAASVTESDTMRIGNGLIGTGLSSPTSLFSTPVTGFRLGIGKYPTKGLDVFGTVGVNTDSVPLITPTSTITVLVADSTGGIKNPQIKRITAPLSGAYVPTLSNTTNVTSSSADTATWIQIGNIVEVTGQVTVVPTAGSSSTALGISLPIASTLTIHSLFGLANSSNEPIATNGWVNSSAGGTVAVLGFLTGASFGSTTLYYHYQYIVH